MKHTRYSTLLRLLLALVALAGSLYWSAGVGDRFRFGLHINQIAREPFEFDGDTRRVTSVEPEAARAGLVEGAKLESLNGAVYTGVAQWKAVLNPTDPGDQVLIGFRRADGTGANAVITLASREHSPGIRSGLSQTWQNFALFNGVPLVCMLVGYWVVFAKPTDPNAWLLLILLLYPQTLFSNEVGGWSTGNTYLLRVLYLRAVQSLSWPALLLFALYFPERSRIDVRRPWLKWLVLGPAIACAFIDLRQGYGADFLAGNPNWLIHLTRWNDQAERALALASIAFYLLLLFRKSRTAASADNRRRLRVQLAGTGTGLIALEVVFMLLPALGYTATVPGRFWLAYLGSILFLLAPLTLAYVVLVQRAMDVGILLRQGTRYALARGSVNGVQAAALLAIGYFLLLPLLKQEQVPPLALLKIFLLLGLVIGLRMVLGKRLLTQLDRRFFREAYDSEQVLNDLAVQVRRYTESAPLLRTVSNCVAETLHVSRITMLLRDGQEFRAAEPALALPVTGSTIRRLTNSSAPAQLYREAPEAWYMLAGERERHMLDELGAELLLALPGRERLMGVMALGPKQSEAAYSKSDLRLLETLASQTGMALEISELVHSLAREATERARVTRELEIAREVQERLLPQTMPQIHAGSVAGSCRPAQGVGGDYFDVFPLDDGRLGLAIGDVSGKGISAALLMSSLRASLRSTVMEFPSDFARMMDKVNRLIYESSASHRYATFFFGALHPQTLLLECVNAGHNAPLVLRKREGREPEILQLTADGPVVGLLPDIAYSEQRLQLRPGDLLLAYTDGISEAMNLGNEEWGEQRMLETALRSSASSASEALDIIFQAADAFTAGAAQYDDMTLLVLRLHESAGQPKELA